MTKTSKQTAVLAASLLLALASCEAQTPNRGAAAKPASGKPSIITIDGSSTVFPITEAVAEEFRNENSARVTIGVSGTGGGFKKFCSKETAMTGASRPIKPSEVELCKKNGVEYIELPVAYDGLAVVVHPDNDWVSHMTVDELKVLWRPEAQGKVKKWSHVRTGWPETDVRLFGPGVDSGTYDYFTKAIVGKEHSSRGDFVSSEDDNVLVKGVSTDKRALGFFGFAYYAENKDSLRLVPIDDGDDENGKAAIAPSPTTVANGTYQPLSRPIFVYVGKAEAERREVKSFIDFYLKSAPALVTEVGYIPLPDSAYKLVQKRFDAGIAGSVFAGSGSRVGVSVEDLLAGQ